MLNDYYYSKSWKCESQQFLACLKSIIRSLDTNTDRRNSNNNKKKKKKKKKSWKCESQQFLAGLKSIIRSFDTNTDRRNNKKKSRFNITGAVVGVNSWFRYYSLYHLFLALAFQDSDFLFFILHGHMTFTADLSL